jgi:hypothetical protein
MAFMLLSSSTSFKGTTTIVSGLLDDLIGKSFPDYQQTSAREMGGVAS